MSANKTSLSEQFNIMSSENEKGITDKDYILNVLKCMYEDSAYNYLAGLNQYPEIIEDLYINTQQDVPADLSNLKFSEYMKLVLNQQEYFALDYPDIYSIMGDFYTVCDIDVKAGTALLFIKNFLPCSSTNNLVREFLKFNYKAYKEVLKEQFGYDIHEFRRISAKRLGQDIEDDNIRIMHIVNYFDSERHSYWSPYSSVDEYVFKIRTAYSLLNETVIEPWNAIVDGLNYETK